MCGVIAVDTNVIVRLLTQDDETQYQASRKLFSSEEIFIADTVIQEVEWVLRYAYDFEPTVICAALRRLFGLPNVHLNNAQLIAQAIDWHQHGLDFSDAFHLALSQQHAKLKTFDERFVKRAKKLSKCLVEKP
jgi:predicted nucleic-acid-binding protein